MGADYKHRGILGRIYTMYITKNPAAVGPPGIAYVSYDSDLSLRLTMDRITGARIIMRAKGNEAGIGKGIAVYNVDDAVLLCDIEWDGVGIETNEGPWYDVALIGQRLLRIDYKGSSGTETIAIAHVGFEVR